MGNEAVGSILKDQPGIKTIEAKYVSLPNGVEIMPICHPSYYARGAGDLWTEVVPRMRAWLAKKPEILEEISLKS